MKRRTGARLCVLPGILAVLWGRPAVARTASCPVPTIAADASVRARWPGLIERVQESFDARDDIDTCARVELRADVDAVIVHVLLADGRSASRPVSRREDVVPTLEALLLLPEPLEPAPLPATDPSDLQPPVAPLASPPTSQPAAALEPARDLAHPSARPSSHIGFELSALTGARIGDGQMSVGLGALSFLDLSGWLVGFGGRVDRYRRLDESPTDGGALELAVLAGRRLRFHSMAFDLIAGPAAALQGTATSTRQVAPGTAAETSSSSSTVPRLIVDARVTFGVLSTLRTFVAVDGDFGPARMGDADVPPDAPRLPVWTLGLALGATVGTQ